MRRPAQEPIRLTCPHCGSRLTIDAALGQVISHEPALPSAKNRDLHDAHQLLEAEAQRREDLFKQSAEAEKAKSQLLDRKFKEVLKRSKDEPPTAPLRDIDLD